MQFDFIQPEEEEVLEPLRMEHFYFPLIIWGAGLVLATISFLVEVLKKRGQHREKRRDFTVMGD